MISYQFNHQAKAGFFREYNAVASYQNIEESRITREYKRYDRLDKRLETVKVAGFTLDARRKVKQEEIITGLDLQFNGLRSIGTRTNLITNEITSLDSRYPNGKNRMNLAAIYLQHLHKFGTGKLILNQGIRLQYSNFIS